MSYINVSVSFVNDDSVSRAGSTLNAGFSREGGRLDLLERIVQPDGFREPIVTQFAPTLPALDAPARGLLDAVLGAGGVRSVSVASGSGRPSVVTWADASGTTMGTASLAQAPAGVLDVIEAAKVLDAAAR